MVAHSPVKEVKLTFSSRGQGLRNTDTKEKAGSSQGRGTPDRNPPQIPPLPRAARASLIAGSWDWACRKDPSRKKRLVKDPLRDPLSLSKIGHLCAARVGRRGRHKSAAGRKQRRKKSDLARVSARNFEREISFFFWVGCAAGRKPRVASPRAPNAYMKPRPLCEV